MKTLKLFVSMILLLAFLAGCSTTSRKSPPQPETPDEVTTVYSDDAFLNLVRKYASDDGESVDYESWKASAEDMAALDDHIAVIARVSPKNQPQQFPTASAKKSYWINTYNALVLHAVLELWPLDSVRDIKVSVSSRVIPGKGFFYDRKVVVGGEETGLYQLEKDVLASQKDPRLHFALNCASESCPVLRPWEWTEEQLDTAAREFVNKPENVSVEDETVLVSRIFKWYRKDFPKNLAAYLQQYAGGDLKTELQMADAGGYRVKYRDYDWSLNGSTEDESGE
jgi:hypothetical protein